ncbi:peptidylprolyl isomerase [Vibrio astriarenae]|uniref:peptidylprolyl isomerase n=1 Tax=Vibrio astriarenae TaxID=1481923 RepID=UPI003735033C
MKKLLLLCSALISGVVFAGPKVQFETSHGNFVLELNEEKAPITVENFLRYVDDGSYKGTIFHRVIPGFMAQGGGFNEEMQQIPTYAPIKNEANNGLKNDTATIAMARTNDPHSATRQFFINYANNDFLNASSHSDGYAVFGQVTEGFETIVKIGQIPTKRSGRMQDVPAETVVITNVSRLD